ncbi:MAG: FlgD immunoglobulin-like domain containing protein [Candidatus Eiseniibacteriota bacterium]|jgi:hypothetical protein
MLSPKQPLSALLVALGAMLLAMPGSASAQIIFYDLDFSTPPHTVGLPPAIGAGPAPRETVSAITFGTPTVIAAYGGLTDQPCAFDSFDGTGDQFSLSLFDLPASTFYRHRCRIEMGNVAAGDGLTILYDTPQVRSIRFDASGNVQIFVPGIGSATIASFNFATVIDLRVDINLATDVWEIYLDGALEHSGSFGGAAAVERVRYSTEVVASPPGASFAVDDITIADSPAVPGAACERLEFEDLPAGGFWVAGDAFTTEGVFVEVGPFFSQPGPCIPPTTSNFARISNLGRACGGGQELEINNVTLRFDFDVTVTDIVIPYGEYGGTVDLGINGDCRVVQNFADLNGAVLGGVQIQVVDFGVPGQGCGVILLQGPVDALLVGGQELWIDNLAGCEQCTAPERSAFEDLPLFAAYPVGSSFTSEFATYEVRPFFFGPGCTNPFSQGEAKVENNGFACGSGQEIFVNNTNLALDSPLAPYEWVLVDYGEYGGNLNLTINGDCREFDDFADVSGQLIGGVAVFAVDYGAPGQGCGKLYATGTIDEYVIGGQELYIDNLRVCPVETTGIDRATRSLPATSRLDQNRPNPFNPSTSIAFELAAAGPTRLEIFDIAGRQVRALVDGQLPAGAHRVTWDGTDQGGRRVASGVYVYRLETAGTTVARRMIVLK